MADIELLPLPEWAIHPKHVTVEVYPSQLHAGLKAYARANVEHHTAGLRYEVKTLRDLCAAAYQMAGVHDAPVEWLDALSNAANGKPFSTDGLLPYMPEAVCDAEARAKKLEEALRAIQKHTGEHNTHMAASAALREQENRND